MVTADICTSILEESKHSLLISTVKMPKGMNTDAYTAPKELLFAAVVATIPPVFGCIQEIEPKLDGGMKLSS